MFLFAGLWNRKLPRGGRWETGEATLLQVPADVLREKKVEPEKKDVLREHFKFELSPTDQPLPEVLLCNLSLCSGKTEDGTCKIPNGSPSC